MQAHPDVDVVQLQINYLDWDDPAMEAHKCYDVAARYAYSCLDSGETSRILSFICSIVFIPLDMPPSHSQTEKPLTVSTAGPVRKIVHNKFLTVQHCG